MLLRMAEGRRGTGTVRVGTASWTDPTLVKSGWYPKGVASSAEARLRFYASRFPLVEVDATYYYLPREEQAGLWVERTPPDFVFNVKAFSLLTGHPTQRKALPEELLEEVAPEHRDKQRLYASHLSADGMAEVWRRFQDALLPLDSAGKLGAVLLQSGTGRYCIKYPPRRLVGGHRRSHTASLARAGASRYWRRP
jgi:uncharacterized protein YecE (DUF72 family)